MTNLRVGVGMLPQLLPSDWADESTVAVVIDTLRFTSTACVALQAGAKSITVMSQIDAARQLAGSSEPPMLLCGERHCKKIPGFDLGNSPLEYTAAHVADRELIFSTTNGTLAVEAARLAKVTALGSLLNRAAVAKWLASIELSTVWIVCSGTDGEFAQEDVLSAGAIIEQMLLLPQTTQFVNDSALLALSAWRSVQHESRVLEYLQTARGGRNLIESGFATDVEFVAALDRSRCVPVLRGGVFVADSNSFKKQ